jgi:hypothetical protein
MTGTRASSYEHEVYTSILKMKLSLYTAKPGVSRSKYVT